MTGITSDIDARSAFSAAAPNEPRTSSVIDDVQNEVMPGAKYMFNRASSGVESFIENHPDMAKWGAIGIALVAAPTLMKMFTNLTSNPAGFAKDFGMLGAKLAGGLALASVVGTFVSNGDFSWDGAKNALSQTVDDVGNLLGMNDDADGRNGPPQIHEDGAGPASVAGNNETPSMSAEQGTEVAAVDNVSTEEADPASATTETIQPIKPMGLGL